MCVGVGLVPYLIIVETNKIHRQGSTAVPCRQENDKGLARFFFSRVVRALCVESDLCCLYL